VGLSTQITTERLVLRPFQADDVEDALAYRDDVEFARFLPHIPQPFTRRDAEAMVTTNMTERPSARGYARRRLTAGRR
jgi:[ribosomal protein S5]-alanine N-acetyltransferase